jgi:methylphosphotriester-DNA--protein-cysteine methyltransferase
VAIVVIDVTDARGRSMAPAIAAVRQRFPAVPVLGYCSATGGGSSGLVDAVRAGATALVIRGIDDERYAIRAAIGAARRATIAQRIQDEVGLHLPASVHPLLRYALSRSADESSVEDAARSLGVDRKTIFNWMRPAGTLGPSGFLNWIRLAIVVGTLENPGRSAEQAALEAGFPSGTSFRNMLRRYTGMTCSQIRNAGGLARVLNGLVAALDSETEAPLIYPMPIAATEMRRSARPVGA